LREGGVSLLLSWRIWAAVFVAVAMFATHTKAYRAGAQSVQAAWDAEHAQVMATALAVTQANREKKKALQSKADTLRRTKNAQIAKLGTDLAAALDGLRDRPARPGAGDLPGTPSIGAGATGASLWRDDGEFLTRLAARADRLRLDLGQCQDAYQAARDALK
jgi:hypothetical protein